MAAPFLMHAGGSEMRPVSLLLAEHRLIERVADVLAREAGRIARDNTPDAKTIERVLDFHRTYVGRTHYGKEEVLLKALAAKPLSTEDRAAVAQLEREHALATELVSRLARANAEWAAGNASALKEMAASLRGLAELYPQHIGKEDRDLLFRSLEYLGPQEQDDLLQQFLEHDRQMIHEKYRWVVEQMERGGRV